LQDIRPVIVGSRYAAELPMTGAGSKEGARTMAVYFKNGASLRFMSGGGSDAARASETARVVAITETSRMDSRSGTSVESNKVIQLKARTKSYDDDARIYMESTPTVEDGLAWQNHIQGSQSKICLQCPHCLEWYIPTDTGADRATLVGWKEAKDVIEAGETGCFACLHCGKAWTEAERRAANLQAVLIHKGQRIERPAAECAEPMKPISAPGGFAVVGPMPRTKMLGFRWSAINNMLRSAGAMAAEEWSAARAVDEDDALRAIHQNLWALPYKPELTDVAALSCETIQERLGGIGRGLVPADTKLIGVGIDLGKYRAYYVVIAECAHYHHIAEYGCLDIPTPDLGLEKATLTALREFRDRCLVGWGKIDGGTMPVNQVFIDINYADSRDAVIAFCRESDVNPQTYRRFHPLIGHGEGPEAKRRYNQPRKTGNTVHFAGLNYHLSWFTKEHLHVVECNVDQWKSWVHDRLAMPLDGEGRLTLYDGIPAEHLTFAKHLTAERRVQEFSREKGGVIVRWQRMRPSNHYFDAAVYAAAASHYASAMLARSKNAAPGRRMIPLSMARRV
jgi:phage terminase large subunit GpA-like protein